MANPAKKQRSPFVTTRECTNLSGLGEHCRELVPRRNVHDALASRAVGESGRVSLDRVTQA